MFLSSTDYKKQIKDGILSQVIDSDSGILLSAEITAQEEITGYLKSQYNTVLIFSATGDSRNAYIVMIMVDIVLYHIHSRINPNQVPQIRIDRYYSALDWLKAVNAGKITPDLPPLDTDNTNTVIAYGSNEKRNNNFY